MITKGMESSDFLYPKIDFQYNSTLYFDDDRAELDIAFRMKLMILDLSLATRVHSAYKTQSLWMKYTNQHLSWYMREDEWRRFGREAVK